MCLGYNGDKIGGRKQVSCVLCWDVTLINHSKMIHAVYVPQQLPPTVTQHVDMLMLHPLYIYIRDTHTHIYTHIYVYIHQASGIARF